MEDKFKNLKEKLLYKPKTVFEVMTADQHAESHRFSDEYINFLNASKTEREAAKTVIALAEEKYFKPYKLGQPVAAGEKYYYNNRDKAVFLFVIGSENIENGIRISAAHIDSPRIDLKQSPLYEDSGFAYFKTHYYGGIKKYQWTARQLALHGRIVRADGSAIDVTIGEDENDPIFYISDLLPHLAKDQMSKNLADAISGEALNIIIGTQPHENSDGADMIKLGVMKYLNDKYGICERDFLSAELSVVPCEKARYVGFDRTLIGGYGHDDRVCAYPSVRALLEADAPKNTIMAVIADKEETGSDGVTGMKSQVFSDIVNSISSALGANSAIVRSNSACLSADVNAAFDPNFAEVYEKRNSSFINRGVILTKFTGSRGKSGTSDASAEFVGKIRKILDDAGVLWQSGELGKVDQGGGGTVAMYIANQNIDTLDLGVSVVSMHSPCEVISSGDLFMLYSAFKAFFV